MSCDTKYNYIINGGIKVAERLVGTQAPRFEMEAV
ncbi:peroxiredoxin, partial [Listeria monocytogenes]|nr:peroxiredoxin [Listeria monocytogenes]